MRTLEIVKTADGVYQLRGVLNETANLSLLLKAPPPLTLDLSGLTRLNSIGIRTLLKFVTEWSPRGFTYLRCPVDFVSQINMIPSLLGPKPPAGPPPGKVASLFVPFECPSCDREDDILVQAAELSDSEGISVLEATCPKCGAGMQVPHDSYFVFMKYLA